MNTKVVIKKCYNLIHVPLVLVFMNAIKIKRIILRLVKLKVLNVTFPIIMNITLMYIVRMVIVSNKLNIYII
jgi:hypothetical protein